MCSKEILQDDQSCTSGKAGCLNCEPLNGLASYAGISSVKHLQLIEPFILFLLLSDVIADLLLVSTQAQKLASRRSSM